MVVLFKQGLVCDVITSIPITVLWVYGAPHLIVGHECPCVFRIWASLIILSETIDLNLSAGLLTSC
jgi:hypothetical protein